MGRLLRSSLTAALCLAVLPTTGASGVGDDLQACRERDQITIDGAWARIRAPRVSNDEGDRKITAFAASPNVPGWLYTTNGRVVKLSGDHGCTWNTIYRSDSRVPGGPGHTPDIFTHLSTPGEHALWVAGYDDVGGVPRPHVYQTGDSAPEAAQAFGRVDTGLPQVGKPVDFEAPSVDPGIAYVLLEQPAAGSLPTRRLYTLRFEDDPPELRTIGTIWHEMTLPPGLGPLEGFTLSTRTRTVWVWSGDKYAVTTDADADETAWTTYTAAGEIHTIDMTRGGVATVVSVSGQGPVTETVQYRDGRYAKTGESSLPVVPTAFAHGSKSRVFTVAGEGGVFGYDARERRWVNVTPADRPTLDAMIMPPGGVGRIVLGMSRAGADGENALYRFDTFKGELFIKPKDPLPGTGDPNNPQFPTSNLTGPFLSPIKQVVTIEPGKDQDVPVTFAVPPTTTPLDVFFIVDTTTSMGGAIRGLRGSIRTIATDLKRRLGKRACFGVGDVKDKDAGSGVVNSYRTHMKINCNDQDFSLINTALLKLEERGGGDTPEAQSLALDQAVKGNGHTNPYVATGQDAGFRAAAFKVIVLITDAPFNQGSGYPSIDDTVDTLNSRGVKVVNVLLINSTSTTEEARADMTRIAVGTETLAPEAGVDCDGDNVITSEDLGPGDPLICATEGGNPNIGPAIIGLLLGVTDPGTLAVEVDDKHQVVRKPIRGRTSKETDLKREGVLTFTMNVGCVPEQDGLDLPVGLTPTVRAKPIGLFGEVIVACRAIPIVPPPLVREPEPYIEPARPPRPPAAVPIQIPPNPPVQPVSNVNPNAGFSQQEEEQYQVATVTQESAETEQEEGVVEMAMSALDRRENDMAAGAFLLGGAALFSGVAAAGYAYRRRTQRATCGNAR